MHGTISPVAIRFLWVSIPMHFAKPQQTRHEHTCPNSERSLAKPWIGSVMLRPHKGLITRFAPESAIDKLAVREPPDLAASTSAELSGSNRGNQ